MKNKKSIFILVLVCACIVTEIKSNDPFSFLGIPNFNPSQLFSEKAIEEDSIISKNQHMAQRFPITNSANENESNFLQLSTNIKKNNLRTPNNSLDNQFIQSHSESPKNDNTVNTLNQISSKLQDLETRIINNEKKFESQNMQMASIQNSLSNGFNKINEFIAKVSTKIDK